jgi:hypothetical protein
VILSSRVTADILDTIRETTGDHPFLLLIATATLVALARRPRPARGSLIPMASAVIVLAAYAGVAMWYLSSDAYYDLAEPTIAAVSWLVRLGQSPYHAADAATRYAHIYGPGLFLIHAGVYRLLGASISISKLAGVAAAMASLVMLAIALRQIRPAREVLGWTALAALLYLTFGNISFWTRAEPLLLACVTAGLLCALQRHWLIAAVGVGVAMGLATDLKLTGACYLAPVLPLLVARHQARAGRAMLTAGIVAMLVVALPFVLWPQISLADYRFWLQRSSETGLRVRLLRPNIEWALYLAAPLGLSLFTRERPTPTQLGMLITCALSMTLIIVLGAKPGAGPYHLLPFMPLIVWISASLDTDTTATADAAADWRPRAAIAFIAPAFIIASIQQMLLIDVLRTAASQHVASDITAFADAHPGDRIDMGYGGTSSYKGSAPLTFYRPLLVFRSGKYLIDAPAVQEHQLAGIPIPAPTFHAIARCDVDYWLIPKGEEPFRTRNMYAATLFAPLFSPEFKSTFLNAYHLVSSTDYFDVYACVRLRQAFFEAPR